MTVNHAWMLKGWLLSQSAPAEIMSAIETVIGSLTPDIAPTRSEPTVNLPSSDEQMTASHEKPEKKRRQWSPEARAAAAERLRIRQASGRMKRKAYPDPGEGWMLSESSADSMD